MKESFFYCLRIKISKFKATIYQIETKYDIIILTKLFDRGEEYANFENECRFADFSQKLGS